MASSLVGGEAGGLVGGATVADTLGVAGGASHVGVGSGGGGGDQVGVSGCVDESRVVMSDRVQTLAGSIYQELERMIAQYDEGVVKRLMPLVVNVLESLDFAYTENQEHEVELELLREDNEQLVTQYEREKQLRRIAEQRALELEDNVDEQHKCAVSKMESLESIVRMFELKQKNTADHVSRLEEKEETMKKEYSRLHERYNELLRSHMDYMERTKMALGTDRLDQLSLLRVGSKLPNTAKTSATAGRSSGPVSFGFQSLEPVSRIGDLSLIPSIVSPTSETRSQTEVPQNGDAIAAQHAALSLSHSIRDEMMGAASVLEREQGRLRGQPAVPQSDTGPAHDCTSTNHAHTRDKLQARVWDREMSMDDVTPDHEDTPLEVLLSTGGQGHRRSQLADDSLTAVTKTTSEHRRKNNLYQELSFNEQEVTQETDEQTASDNFFGVGKEIDNLIRENSELLATKNALNIVKDDLITQVDELTGENDILREEVQTMQTVRSRLQLRIQELEEEVKRSREEVDKLRKEVNDEDEVPMAQRKRFTRVEMARVLMERNQYKERYMELQEALKWTEMIRASRNDAALNRKTKQGGVWGFFSNLFSSSDSGAARGVGARGADLTCADVQYESTAAHVTPLVDAAAAVARSELVTGGDSQQAAGASCVEARRRVLDFREANISSEKVQQRLAHERKEQYRKVKAHVARDDGRIQAYGWSLPAQSPETYDNGAGIGSAGARRGDSTTRTGSKMVPVPVPVYCRPLIEKEPGMKVWCAAGVNLTGGQTRDGGSVVGSSVFYLNQPQSSGRHNVTATPSGDILSSDLSTGQSSDAVEALSKHLQEQQTVQWRGYAPELHLSSLVWICTSTHTASKVTVVDANNPADVLESFPVCSSHLLCIASVPGASVDDYSVCDEMQQLNVSDSPILSHTKTSSSPTDPLSTAAAAAVGAGSSHSHGDSDGAAAAIDFSLGAIRLVECATAGGAPSAGPVTLSCSSGDETDIHPVLRRHFASDQCDGAGASKVSGQSGAELRLLDAHSDVVKDGVVTAGEVETVSSVMPTMWLGAQSGWLYVHSARALWRRAIATVKLADSVLAIVHVLGRVLVSLANGTLAVFHRDAEGRWDLTDYHVLDLGQPQHGIRCMSVVQQKVWCGCRNRVHVLEPTTLEVEVSFVAHPRRESQVRQMAWLGDGVWVSIRLDSTLRLYHAHTHQHLQDVDIEPYVTKMLAGCGVSGPGKLGYSFVRISSLVISCGRMWLGTGNGVIISVPLNVQECSPPPPPDTGCESGDSPLEGSTVQVYSDSRGTQLTPASFVPYCRMAQAQLSFHGYRDSVKFFVAVPGVGGMSASDAAAAGASVSCDRQARSPPSLLVMSGGEGYIDFRVGDAESDVCVDDLSPGVTARLQSRLERSHLIVWQTAPCYL